MIKITPTDDNKENEGTWTKYLGVNLKIARTSNPQYVADLVRRSKAFKSKHLQNMIPTDDMTDAVCKAMAYHLLKDWNNLVDSETGESIPFSRDNAYELLKADTDCRNFILEFADEATNYFKEDAAQVVEK